MNDIEKDIFKKTSKFPTKMTSINIDAYDFIKNHIFSEFIITKLKNEQYGITDKNNYVSNELSYYDIDITRKNDISKQYLFNIEDIDNIEINKNYFLFQYRLSLYINMTYDNFIFDDKILKHIDNNILDIINNNTFNDYTFKNNVCALAHVLFYTIVNEYFNYTVHVFNVNKHEADIINYIINNKLGYIDKRNNISLEILYND